MSSVMIYAKNNFFYFKNIMKMMPWSHYIKKESTYIMQNQNTKYQTWLKKSDKGEQLY